MPTQTKENYLKALYYLHQKDSAIAMSDLGKEMGVSKPTANDMVKKLKEKGWVKYQKYKPLHLTPTGEIQAAAIIRKHRLSEMFLSQIMGFGWEEVHDMAEELEHLTSEKFFDRMDELLGFPTVDPHGSPIPDKNGIFAKPDYKLLSQFAEGQEAIFSALKDSSTDFLLYLNKKNIKLGATIRIIQIEPFDKSVSIEYNKNMSVVLSHTICSRLWMEEKK